MPAVEVRRVQERDLMRIFGFCECLFGDVLSIMKPRDRERKLRSFMEGLETTAKKGTGFIGLSAGTPQAYLSYLVHPGNLFIEHLYVHPLFRGYHLGSSLVREAARVALFEDALLELKLPQRTSEDYLAARKFYINLGFNFVPGDDTSLDRMTMRAEQMRGMLAREARAVKPCADCYSPAVYFVSPSRIAMDRCVLCESCRDFIF